jgi:hypothetical protein
MRGELEGTLVSGAGRAGRSIDISLAKAILSGKTGFDDLRKRFPDRSVAGDCTI